jgi:hypothetical protein
MWKHMYEEGLLYYVHKSPLDPILSRVNPVLHTLVLVFAVSVIKCIWV